MAGPIVSSHWLCYLVATAALLWALLLGPAHMTQARHFDRHLLRSFFDCPACDPTACPVPAGFDLGCELILETGVCGCCQVCAKEVGERCGVEGGRCRKGLSCRPLPSEADQLGAILYGRAVCAF